MKNQKHKSQHKFLAYLSIHLVVLSWGFEAILSKLTLQVMPPSTLLFFRILIGLVFIALVKLITEGFTPVPFRQLVPFLLFGVVGYFFNVFFQYQGFTLLPVAHVVIIMSFVAAASVLVDRVLHQVLISRTLLVALFACIGGVALVIGLYNSSTDFGHWMGYVYTFGAMLCATFYNQYAPKLSQTNSNLTILFYMYLFAGLFAAPLGLSALPDWSAITLREIFTILYLGVVGNGLVSILLVYSLSKLGSSKASVFTNLQPATAGFFGWLILKESLTPIQLIGIVVVIVGGYIVIREHGKAEVRKAERQRAALHPVELQPVESTHT